MSSFCRSSEGVPPKICIYVRISSSSASHMGMLLMGRNASDCEHQTKQIRCCIDYTLNNIFIKNCFSKKVQWFSVSKIQSIISLTAIQNTSWKGLIDCVCWTYRFMSEPSPQGLQLPQTNNHQFNFVQSLILTIEIQLIK